jgi:uncharacterized cupredoxin-like copper-binding protein
LAALALAFVPVFAAGCNSTSEPDLDATPVRPTDGAITVVASEWKFDPTVIEVLAGQEAMISLENNGEIVHNLRIDDIDADVSQSSEDGEVFVEAEAGETADLVLTPGESGEFAFYCDVPDHRDLGMEGRLMVVDE